MAWQTPKTNWQPADPLTDADMNRIEGNIEYLGDDNNLLAKIKNVDGSGSGLDADLLDGKHADDFAKGTQIQYIWLTDSTLKQLYAYTYANQAITTSTKTFTWDNITLCGTTSVRDAAGTHSYTTNVPHQLKVSIYTTAGSYTFTYTFEVWYKGVKIHSSNETSDSQIDVVWGPVDFYQECASKGITVTAGSTLTVRLYVATTSGTNTVNISCSVSASENIWYFKAY